MLPKVSIIIPVYNGSNYLSQAIDSALRQDYSNFEIIVVNDGSNDNNATEKIALSYGAKIRYYKKDNGGVASALNFGINHMKGEYFSWLSHDDLYESNKISSQIKIIEKNGDPMAIIYSGYKLVDQNLKLLVNINFKNLYSEKKLNISLFPLFKGLINGCTLLINQKHFENVGKFDVRLKTTQDYEMWFRILKTARIIYQEEIYVKTRFHSNQGSKIIYSHYEESNNTWIKLIESLEKTEMIAMEGSPYLFYYQTAKFFKKNKLLIAYYFVLNKQKEEIEKKQEKIIILMFKIVVIKIKTFYNYLKRVVSIISDNGAAYIMKKIIGKYLKIFKNI